LSWCVLLGAFLTRLRFLKISPVEKLVTPAFPKLLSYGLAGILITGYSALTLRQNDVWQNAQTLWEHTIALYPNSFPGNINLSILYINQKRYSEAERLCLNVLKDLPSENLAGIQYLPLTNLATAQVGLGEYDHAIHNYQEILRLEPGMPQANLGIAHCYWQKKDYSHAYEHYQFILNHISSISPRTTAEILYRAGYSAWRLDHRIEALRLLDKACSIAEKNPALSQSLADVYAHMGYKQKAADCLLTP
jgi:tetratricopeptide (TPR) repeat protein